MRLIAPIVLLSIIALAAPASASAVDITFGDDLEYSPPQTTIDAGESVTWLGNFAEHPLSSASGAFADRATGDRYTVTFDRPGRYTYFCQLHSDGSSGMVARLVVRPGSAKPVLRARVASPRRLGAKRIIRVTAMRSGTASAIVRLSGTTLATGRTSFAKGGTRPVALRLNPAGRARLVQSSTVSAQLRTRIVGRDGKVDTFTQPVTLAR